MSRRNRRIVRQTRRVDREMRELLRVLTESDKREVVAWSMQHLSHALQELRWALEMDKRS